MYKMKGKSSIITRDESLTIFRETNPAYEDGVAVNQPSTQLSVKCNVQPLSGRELQLVPEGDRFREQYWVWAYPETAIRTGDRIERKGKKFEVQSAESWGSYVRARMALIDAGKYAGR